MMYYGTFSEWLVHHYLASSSLGSPRHKQDAAEVAKEFHRYGHSQTWVFGDQKTSSGWWSSLRFLEFLWLNEEGYSFH